MRPSFGSTVVVAAGSALVVAAALAGCADSNMLNPAPHGARANVELDGQMSVVNLYGIGELARRSPRSPCLSGPNRQFDFWIGEWNVFNPAGAQAGTNVITSELDGCVIAEEWAGAGGVRGRSISTYDAETGAWHQTWVSSFTLGHLRLAGGLVNGEMMMNGARESVFGFPFFDDITWTAVDANTVRQVVTLRIPAIDLVSTFTGTYVRTDAVTRPAERETTECQAGGISAETRRLDFLAGTWRVTTEEGKVVGESVVRTDLSDCLFEERFSTAKGYRAVVFTYWDRVVGKWHRTYVDTEGERVELSGVFAGDRLVLQGSERVPGQNVEVRLTIAPGDGGVSQTLELSRDGGATWETRQALRFASP